MFNSTLAEIEISYRPKVRPSELPKVVTSSDAYQILKDVFPNLDYREYFYILCLNRNNKILGYCQISVGGISGTVADVRIIMQTALKSNACSIILSHSHPSGNLQPSEADKDLTKDYFREWLRPFFLFLKYIRFPYFFPLSRFDQPQRELFFYQFSPKVFAHSGKVKGAFLLPEGKWKACSALGHFLASLQNWHSPIDKNPDCSIW